MIRDQLIPALRERFPNESFTFSEPPEPIASLAARNPALGRLEIFDDGDEATLSITEITHGHFSCYEPCLTPEQHEATITTDVLDFLDALFADRVLLYRTPNRSMGGWTRLDLSPEAERFSHGREYFLWSRPYQHQ